MHEIVKCSECCAVIRQCRCWFPDKPVRYEICGKCQALAKAKDEMIDKIGK